MIVADASALVPLLLSSPGAQHEVAEAMSGDVNQLLRAPDVVEPESLHALRGLERSKRISTRQAEAASHKLAVLRLLRYPHTPLRERTWELRHELSAYDASYLALAEALDGAVLITGDRGLAIRARRSLADDAVRLVA